MKKIVTIQDISCVGKCSLTVALPIISSIGIETCVLPTAVLSTHTAFKNFTFRDLTDDIKDIANVWKKENISFDAIYTGYLGSIKQIEILKEFFNEFKTKNNFIFVDPAMADNGKLYSGFDIEFTKRMKSLCSKADVIVPNITESCFMLNKEYKEKFSQKEIEEMLIELTNLGPENAILTGVSFEENRLGVMGYNKKTKEFYSYFKEKIPVKYHGTGDVFASTLVGSLTIGKPLEEAIKIAVDFVWETINDTYIEKKENAYGVNFEMKIPYLLKRINKL
ncbi:MAG: pyridoxamine kinase [Clostridia bacterium]|nr:pyridoxamine kinase [Clostridia bacterium]